MLPKGSTHGRSSGHLKQLAEARANKSSFCDSIPELTLQELLVFSEARLQAAEAKYKSLESALHTEQKQCALLHKALDAERKNSMELSVALNAKKKNSAELFAVLCAERQQSEQLYQNLHMERHARQRGQSRKSVLEDQIRLLKSVETLSVDTKNASKAINALIKVEKENFNLRSELSKTLERCTAEVAHNAQKLNDVMKQTKEYRLLATKLQKCYNQAAVV
jgi:hypothetical protein